MKKNKSASIVSKLRPVLVSFLLLTLICGMAYPVIVTSIAQIAFPNQANGSIITITQENGTTIDVGSALIGQTFTKPQYLIGRPQGTSQRSPFSEAQKAQVLERVAWWQALDPENSGAIPSDLVTASEAGSIPISPRKRPNIRLNGLPGYEAYRMKLSGKLLPVIQPGNCWGSGAKTQSMS